MLNGLLATIKHIKKLDKIRINRFGFMFFGVKIFSFLKDKIPRVSPKTKAILATFEPITFPTTILPLFSLAAKKLVSISGAEVAKAITVAPIKKGETP